MHPSKFGRLHDGEAGAAAPLPPAAGALPPVAWKAPVSGDWSGAANWSAGVHPGPQRGVTIAVRGNYTISVTSQDAAYSVDLAAGAGTIALGSLLYVTTAFHDSGSLEVLAGARLDAASLALDSGAAVAFAAGTDLVLKTALTFGDATLSGLGTLTSAGTATLTQGSRLMLESGVSLYNAGYFVDQGEIFLAPGGGNPVRIVNELGSDFVIAGAAPGVSAPLPGVYAGAGGTAGEASFVNDGTLTLAGTLQNPLTGGIGVAFTNVGLVDVMEGGILQIEAPITNSGRLEVQAGSELRLSGGGQLTGHSEGSGTIALEAGSFHAGTDFFSATGVALDVENAATDLVVLKSQTAASLTAGDGGTVIIAKGIDFTVAGNGYFGFGGNDASYAAHVDGLGTLTTTGDMSVLGNAKGFAELQLGGGLTWINEGNFQDGGGILMQGSHIGIVNEAGASFDLTIGPSNRPGGIGNQFGQGGITVPQGLPGDIFTNLGTLSVTSLSFGYLLACNVENSALIDIAGTGAGTMTSGSLIVYGYLADTATGVVKIGEGGGLGLNGGASIAGTISGAGAGLHLGAGNYTALASAWLNLTILQNGGVFNDSGGLELTASNRIAGAFENEAGATFDLVGPHAQVLITGPFSFRNDGAIRRSGIGRSIIGGPITNSGTIAAEQGTLALGGAVIGQGTLAVAAGATLELGGTVGAFEQIDFTGGGATLQLDHAMSLSSILGFGAGDYLDLGGIAAASATITGDRLDVRTAGSTYSFVATSLAGDSVAFASDGHGGTVISILPGTASAQH